MLLFMGEIDFEQRYSLVKSKEFGTKLNAACLEMGPQKVLPDYRHLWRPNKPTVGYCYVITRYLKHVFGAYAEGRRLLTPEGAHYFICLPNLNEILDFAVDREFPYSEGRKKTLNKGLCKRGVQLSGLMGYEWVDSL